MALERIQNDAVIGKGFDRARFGFERRRDQAQAFHRLPLLMAKHAAQMQRVEIAGIAGREAAGGLVVGLPLSMDGTVGPAAQAARDWASALSAATGLPAALWDERLSTAAVNRMLIDEADLSRARRARMVDRIAATWMLQSALDASR